jgi:dolichol kinase
MSIKKQTAHVQSKKTIPLFAARKALHIAPLALVFGLEKAGYAPKEVLPLMYVLVAGFTLRDLYRKSLSTKVQLEMIEKDPVLQTRELNKMSSSWYYAIGVTLTMMLFEHAACALGIIFLALCDPAAEFFGRRWGGTIWSRRGYDGKSWEGSVMAGLLGGIIAAIRLKSFSAGLWGLPIALFVDAIPGHLGDDNLLWPLISAFLWNQLL